MEPLLELNPMKVLRKEEDDDLELTDKAGVVGLESLETVAMERSDQEKGR